MPPGAPPRAAARRAGASSRGTAAVAERADAGAGADARPAAARACARVSASAAIIAPNTCASTGAAGSADARDAAGSRRARRARPGPTPARRRSAPAAAAAGQTRWKPVARGAATVAKASAVTTPKRRAARAAQRPEQVGLAILVAGRRRGRRRSVDLRGAQAVRGQPVRRPRIPSPPPSVRPAMPTSGPQPAGIVHPVRRERVVDVAEPRAGADRRRRPRRLDRVQRGDVERRARRSSTSARRSSGRRCAAPPAGPRPRRTRAPRRRRARSRSGRRPAAATSREVGDRRAARGVVARRVRQDDLAVEGVLQGAPVRDGHPVTVRDGRRRAQARRRRRGHFGLLVSAYAYGASRNCRSPVGRFDTTVTIPAFPAHLPLSTGVVIASPSKR